VADDASTHGALVLLLADARLPSGAHVHSGGIEQAVDDGVINDVDTLRPFLVGRLLSGGRLAAHVAALTCRLASCAAPTSAEQWHRVDEEVSARIIAPALAATSRRQGRSLLRTGLAVFPGPVLTTLSGEPGAAPHLAVVQGALSGQVGVTPFDAAVVAAYAVVTAAASAALRLLGLDPVALVAVVAQLTPLIDIEARAATSNPTTDPMELPAPAGPLTDLLGQRHGQRKERLFAS
jgi:urease accessory protein